MIQSWFGDHFLDQIAKVQFMKEKQSINWTSLILKTSAIKMII